MWYAADNTGKAEGKHEKSLPGARQTLKWIPCFAVVVLIASVAGGGGYGNHPDVEHLLRLISPVGAALCCLFHWTSARAALAGTRETLSAGGRLLGLILMASGPSLSDMWHRKQMILFYASGSAVLALALFCLVLMVWEWARVGRAGHQA